MKVGKILEELLSPGGFEVPLASVGTVAAAANEAPKMLCRVMAEMSGIKVALDEDGFEDDPTAGRAIMVKSALGGGIFDDSICCDLAEFFSFLLPPPRFGGRKTWSGCWSRYGHSHISVCLFFS